jgi:hypothetical protein
MIQRSFITARVVEHPATASKPAHSTLMWSCSFCLRELAWSSWTRVRGQLGGDSIVALASGLAACMSASSDAKLMFKGFLAAEAEKKNGAQAMKRGLDAAAKAAGGSSSSGSQRLRVKATALAPARIRGERLLVFTSLI